MSLAAKAADEYGGDEDFSWVLLEPAEGASEPRHRDPEPRRCLYPSQRRPENIHVCGLRVKKHAPC